MKAIFSRKSITFLAFTWTLLVIVSACPAQSSPNLDKHARKIHKRLVKYSTGTYLNLAFRDGTESMGLLDTLTETSFTMTNADTNSPETHSYSEVERVERGKEYIGEGSEHGHHFRRWVPVVASAVAAGAVLTAFEVH
jgi:hypothetical protein